MYAQIFFVTSVRGNFFAPQIAASSGLRTFGAKMPFPAFFMAAALRLPAAFEAVLPRRRFSAVIFLRVAFVTVVFVVFTAVVATVVLVVVVIAIGGRKCKHALSQERRAKITKKAEEKGEFNWG